MLKNRHTKDLCLDVPTLYQKDVPPEHPNHVNIVANKELHGFTTLW
jgi:hypothetical protein